jgi:hypothetical protein
MPVRTVSVAQISADDRHQALIGILNSGFHGIRGNEPDKNILWTGSAFEVNIGHASREIYEPLPLAEFIY